MTTIKMSPNKIAIAAAAAMAATFMVSTGAQAHSPTKARVVCTWKGCSTVKPHRHVKAKPHVTAKRRVKAKRRAKAKRIIVRKLAKRAHYRKALRNSKRFSKVVKRRNQRRNR